MNTNETLQQMQQLKFHGMQTSYSLQLELPIHQQLATLLEGHYLRQGENILITGATGCGKSYLACALGHQACIQGYRTTYLNMNRLIEKITLAKLDGTYIKFLNYLERQTLIILDDFGLQSLNQDVKLALLQILEDRYSKRAVIITSQLPVSKWYEFIKALTNTALSQGWVFITGMMGLHGRNKQKFSFKLFNFYLL